MEFKLLTRTDFREGVFARDNYKCVFCDKPAVDAHHILERRLFSDFGYYMENGASVCEEHHLECEKTLISVQDVRDACKITKKCVPEQFYDDHIYDKWGNPVLEDGRRGRGELFHDESVQKILAMGGVLGLFTGYVKYPRTHHLPWSPGVSDDDKVLKDLSGFEGKRVILTKKMDGENTTFYSDHIHARSIDSRGGEDRAWVKQFWASISYNIPDQWRVCGENLWAKHSISYESLPSFFLGFSIWNEKNECLSWDETLEYFELLGITPVEVVYDGDFNEAKIRKICESFDTAVDEGAVLRTADGFKYGEFRKSIAKWVRKDHVMTTRHWRQGARFTPNLLRSPEP